jgi:hypothetical protein
MRRSRRTHPKPSIVILARPMHVHPSRPACLPSEAAGAPRPAQRSALPPGTHRPANYPPTSPTPPDAAQAAGAAPSPVPAPPPPSIFANLTRDERLEQCTKDPNCYVSIDWDTNMKCASIPSPPCTRRLSSGPGLLGLHGPARKVLGLQDAQRPPHPLPPAAAGMPSSTTCLACCGPTSSSSASPAW